MKLLMTRMNEEANKELASTLEKMIEELSREFRDSIGDKSLNIENNSHWTLDPEYRGIYYISQCNSNKLASDVHAEIFDGSTEENTVRFLESAVTEFLSSRECAIRHLHRDDYALAMEHAFEMARNQGCIAAARNIAIAKKFFDNLSRERIKAAKSKSIDNTNPIGIFLSLANKHKKSCSGMTELLDKIAEEFRERWGKDFPDFPPKWNPENFQRYIDSLRKKNEGFNSAYNQIKDEITKKSKAVRLATKK